jgi:hypothetical protein
LSSPIIVVIVIVTHRRRRRRRDPTFETMPQHMQLKVVVLLV